VVVGPNGSGNSNVSDSILWATGSLSPGEMRAEKPDDVLFAGSAGRQASDLCEVDLLFDNADSAWPDLPYAEVSVARRLQRGGEGQYLVNRTPVRRLDLVELLSDVGLGGGLRSVISQGRVETVLNSKPEERRELDEQIAALVAERERAEEELTDSAGAREQATAALYRLRSGGERVALRRESAASLLASLRAELEAARAHDPSASAELDSAARTAAAAAQAAVAERARREVEAEEA